MVADQIHDVAKEAITVRRPSSRRDLLGSPVVGKLVADFLDLGKSANITAPRSCNGV
jgi:hypothetical protein